MTTDKLKNEKINKKPLAIIASVGFLFGVVVSSQVATQVLAYETNYHPSLGSCVTDNIYYPWSIYVWYFKWGAEDPDLFTNAIEFGYLSFLVFVIVLMLIILGFISKLKPIETLHGSARWANKKELYDCSLLQKDNDPKPYVYVGGFVDKKGKMHYLRHSGPEHILCYAPTRSGKGVGLVIPTLLSWSESAVITDLKGELWALTAGYRKSIGQKVIRFEPASKDSAHWNPLSEIRIGTDYEVGDAQNLANMIVDPDGKGLDGHDGHWKKTSFALYTGLILHVLYKQKNGDLKDKAGNPEEASMRTIDNLLSDTDNKISALWDDMKTYKHLGDQPHPVVAASGQDQSDRPEEEAGSVLSTVKSNLSLFRDPIVTNNTAKGDFKIRDIMNCKDPVSVYVVTQPNDKARLKPLIRIFVNMTVRLLADKMKFVDGRAMSCNHHRLLMMLDEFPSLGKLDIMQESLAFVAGYGIKCYLITQDLSQLKNDYGQNESITSNCHIQNAYPPNRMDTAEYLSKMAGTTTIVKKSITRSGKGVNKNDSVTMQEVQRPLLTPDECMRLKGATKNTKGEITEAGDMLIFVAGYPAIYGKQILYFKDNVFLNRSKIPAPKFSDVIKEEDRYKDPETNKEEIKKEEIIQETTNQEEDKKTYCKDVFKKENEQK